MSQVSELRISYRKENQKDFKFLVELYGTTRDDVAQFGSHLSRDERYNFIESQFKLQCEHYAEKYKKAKYEIIRHEGRDIGRLITNNTKKSLHIIFFAIQPSARSKGIGKFIFSSLIERAKAEGKNVSIYVKTQNESAKAFYDKLGFVIKEGGTDFYDFMETKF